MSKDTLCQPAGITQPETHTPVRSSGFEHVGVIINRMMTNLVDNGDMLYGEDRPRRGPTHGACDSPTEQFKHKKMEVEKTLDARQWPWSLQASLLLD